MPTPQTLPIHTHDEINTALNRAADQITDLAIIKLCDESLTDLVNLLANAGLHYLDHPGDTLADVIDANWSADDAGEIRELLA